jgi:hypothetical protein
MSIVRDENGSWYLINTSGEKASPKFDTEVEIWDWIDKNDIELND